ncbi:unnamed protein product [Discula destructiva]
MAPSRGGPIEIDDDETASEVSSDERPEKIAFTTKRKRQDVDVWAEEPDEVEEYKKRQKDQKRQRRAGKSVAKAKGRPQRANSRLPHNTLDASDVTVQDGGDGDLLTPDYLSIFSNPGLVERRTEFEENRKSLGEGGLKLAPTYDDLDFSDDERDPEELEERPKFDSIQACRPYEDVILEQSAGLIPASIAQYLRDYQVKGVRFLHEHFVYQTGAILGDDMGLGKTVQVAAFLTAAFGKTGDERDAKRLRKVRRDPDGRWYPRVIIVCPGTLIPNWKSELDRWGWWKVSVFHGSEKDDALRAARLGAVEIMLTTYSTYELNQGKVNAVEWDAVIADECHLVKGLDAKVTKAMANINALCRIGLTGTAIQNKYEEFWTLLNWTNPGRFGALHDWDASIVKPLTRGQSHDATMQELSLARKTARKLVENLLPPFFLRRMKSLIAHQLPKKTDKVVFCPLTTAQKNAYERLLKGVEITAILESSKTCGCGSRTKYGWCHGRFLPDGRSWRAVVFPCIQALQKLSNHLTILIPPDEIKAKDKDQWTNALRLFQQAIPTQWKALHQQRHQVEVLANPEFCGKWKILKELLSLWYSNKDKVLVFSHSVRLLHILESLFKKTSYSVSFLSGSLRLDDRQKEVDDFNSDPAKFVFLISTKAGGVGLNITSANKVVIFDPHWNPAYDLQAQDRAYRIGQLRDVEVYRLVAAGTIEEIVYARQIYKQQQANIGYNASNERRYFKGVQQDPDRKGELFGMQNLFSFKGDQVVLQGIVNQTNVAEARVGMRVMDVDMEKLAEDNEFKHINVKKEGTGDDDGGLSQLAAYIKAEDPDQLVEKSSNKTSKVDAVQAILHKAGVRYTHENSEVIGSSKVEAQLSRRAMLAEPVDFDDPEGESALFAEAGEDVVLSDDDLDADFAPEFHPPEDVRIRQFCSMAKEAGLSALDFAFTVEQMTQEERREALDAFYKRRMAKLIKEQLKKKSSDDKKVGRVKAEEDVSRHSCDDIKVKDKSRTFTLEQTETSVERGLELKSEVVVKMEPGVDRPVTPISVPLVRSGSISALFIDVDDDDEL